MGADERDVLYIIIPAYNERENIKNVIEEWYPVIEKYDGNKRSRLVIINDGSKDDTFDILQREGKNRSLLVPLTKKNGGHGDTVLFGYKYALKNGADYIFQTDSDGQTRPEEFHMFWKKREQYKAMIGYRNHRKDGISRILVTKILRLVVFLCFGVWVTDANTPFRLMEASTLKKYLKLIPDHFNLPNVVLSVIYVKFCKDEVKFIPITFRERQGGTNSINLKSIVRIGRRAVIDFIKIRKSLSNENKK